MKSKNSRDAVVRHIEVKGSIKHSVPSRWLEEREYKALRQDKKFYLYIVTGVGTHRMKVNEFTQKKTLKHFNRKEIKYIFTFAKEDFS